MKDAEAHPQSEAEAATSKLERGLKSCRSVISSYRSLILADDGKSSPGQLDEESETPPQS